MGLFSNIFGKRPARPKNYFGPADRCVYAIGDIHGRADLLEKLLEQICDRIEQSDKLAEIVFLGDYVDRGDDSKDVLDLCLKYKQHLTENPRIADVVFLRGNHEEAMLRFLEQPVEAANWLSFGGLATIGSYHVPGPANPVSMDDFITLAEGLREVLPNAHREFLEELQSTHIAGDYFFVHAAVEPDLKLEDQPTESFYWGTASFLNKPWVEAYKVVHGHTITPAPDIKNFRIGIDTGAYYTGVLTAICIDGADVSFVDTGRNGG